MYGSLSPLFRSLYVSLRWSSSSSLVHFSVRLCFSVKIPFTNLKVSLVSTFLVFCLSLVSYSTLFPFSKDLNASLLTSSYKVFNPSLSSSFDFIHLLRSYFFSFCSIFIFSCLRGMFFPSFFVLVVNFKSESSGRLFLDAVQKSR